MNKYPEDNVGPEDDDGTMPLSVDALREAVVGHRIIRTEANGNSLTITLDDGTCVEMIDSSSCCAYTDLNSFLMHPTRVDHIITGVGTTGGYTTWHIYADMGDVLELSVNWSCGNPFWYGYGFEIRVTEPKSV